VSSPTSSDSWPDPSGPPPQLPTGPLPPPPTAPSYPAGGYRAAPLPPGNLPPPGYGGFPTPPGRSGLAVASMVVSIVSAATLVCGLCAGFFWFVSIAGGVVGLVLGAVARRRITESAESGGGMALTGIVVGAIAAGLGLLLGLLSVVLLGFFPFGAGA